MGNKVIRISSSESNSESEQYTQKQTEVYKDISTSSQKKQVYTIGLDRDGKTRRNTVLIPFLEKEVNVKAVFDSINNIFSWIPGERILNPEFGSKLRYYLYEGITQENKEQIAAEVMGVCFKWEPRVNIIRVTPIDNAEDAENNTVRLDIEFTIPSLSNKQYLYSYTYDRTQ